MNNRVLFFKRAILNLFSIIFLVFLDQFSKMQAFRYLKDATSIPLISGVLELRYLENRGAAFGIFQNRMLFFYIATFIVLAAIFYVFLRLPYSNKYLLLNFLLVLITAGAIGNLIDRVRQNYVVDFIYASFIDFPIFNVADIYVTTGTTLLVISVLFYYHDEDFDFLKADKSS
ncbi:MAG: signal peptidase II [Lachnospiraceae bacterium]|nr:signal peptidase II [Lachnospiraceae bacterium]